MEYARGTGEASLCYYLYDGENDKFYATVRTVFNFTDPPGSYYDETTQPGGIVLNDEECGELEFDSSFDPEAAYGTPAGTEDEYLNEVSPPAASAALGAMIWGDPESPDALPLTSVNWHGQPIDIFLVTESSTSFARATAQSDRVRFRVVRGYHYQPLSLQWTDSASGSGSLAIPTNGAWSDWLAADNNTEISTAQLKGGKYA